MPMSVRMISVWILALFYRLGKRGEEKDTECQKYTAEHSSNSQSILWLCYFSLSEYKALKKL